MGIEKVLHEERNECKTTPYTGAHTNLYPISLLMYWLFSWIYRKCLGLIWTFHTPRARMGKNRRVSISQDYHTCEVCYSPLWWPHKLPKRRRASPETSEKCGVSILTDRKVLIVSCQVFNYFGMYNYWHIYPSIWHRSYYIMDPRVFNENGDRGI